MERDQLTEHDQLAEHEHYRSLTSAAPQYTRYILCVQTASSSPNNVLLVSALRLTYKQRDSMLQYKLGIGCASAEQAATALYA